MTKAFSNLDDNDLPAYPMFMEMTPDGEYWWIAGIEGELVQVRQCTGVLVRDGFCWRE